MIIADYHVHSDFSSDSKAPMEEMVKKAISLGLKRICFTDHMDYDYPKVSDLTFLFDFEAYIKKINFLKEKYKTDINILTGIELGLQPHLTKQLTDLVNSHPVDFIIGSSHVVDHYDPYYKEYWEGKTKKQGMQAYFQSIIDNCRAFQGFHVYGHIDYIVRYVPKHLDEEIEYSYNDYAEILDEVLKTILHYERGIEVNSAGLKYGLSFPHPKVEILQRYRELGGEIITIGSDAHLPEHLCYEFNKIGELLRSIGFKYYTTFIQGKPVFEPL